MGNWPLWRTLLALPENGNTLGLLFAGSFAAMVAALTFVLLSLAAWRRTIKPITALFLLPAAAGAHFMGTFGVVIDPTMMTNVVQTNVTETRDLLSPLLFASIGVIALLPLAWLWRLPVQRLGFGSQLGRNLAAMGIGLVVLVALLFASFADLSATMRNHRSVRYLINPLNSFYAVGALVHRANASPKGPPLAIGEGATLAPREDAGVDHTP